MLVRIIVSTLIIAVITYLGFGYFKDYEKDRALMIFNKAFETFKYSGEKALDFNDELPKGYNIKIEGNCLVLYKGFNAISRRCK